MRVGNGRNWHFVAQTTGNTEQIQSSKTHLFSSFLCGEPPPFGENGVCVEVFWKLKMDANIVLLSSSLGGWGVGGARKT